DNDGYIEEQKIYQETSPADLAYLMPVAEERFTVDRIPGDIEDDRADIGPNDKVILIIEDDTAFAKTLLGFTRKRNYKGLVAVRGDAGIEMAKKYNPLAILLDIQLPIMDGWQVMEELKSNSSTRAIPVHIMSSLSVKRESLLKGAVDFIDKPIALEQMKVIFEKLEDALSRYPKKVLIVEENEQHAKALSYFLSSANIHTLVVKNVNESINALQQKEVDIVILDMGVPDRNAYETLETIKKSEGLEKLPIIIFTGKNLSKGEEVRIKQYADSIVVKTAHSYQRILDEAGLFLHLVEEKKKDTKFTGRDNLGGLNDVLKNKTVLIADDDVRNIFSLTKALEQHQMKVLPAIDGKEALRVLEENADVDVVLMDMMMPELDGYQTTRAIREQNAYRNLPILAVTAKAMMGDREKCIAAGASDYISKPVDVDQLVSLLRVWLYK
ncbi:MAG: response regulator, partial [Chitinophagaceae bacterium]